MIMRSRLRDERGAAVTVWTVLIAAALTMIVGLAVDLSGRVNTARLAGDVAAQAARTAGQQLDADVYTSTGGDVEVAAARAKTAAIAYAKAAGMTATARIESGTDLVVEVERRLRAGVPVSDRDRHPTRHRHRPRPGRQSPRREGTLMLAKLRGLLALLGLAAIVIGMPALLIAAAPIGVLSITWTPEGIWQALATPDNGTIALALFKLVGWIAWAILTVAVFLELIGLLRRTPVPHLPGFAVPQLLARRLVATAAVLFIATSTLTTSGIEAPPVAQAAGAPQAPAATRCLPTGALRSPRAGRPAAHLHGQEGRHPLRDRPGTDRPGIQLPQAVPGLHPHRPARRTAPHRPRRDRRRLEDHHPRPPPETSQARQGEQVDWRGHLDRRAQRANSDLGPAAEHARRAPSRPTHPTSSRRRQRPRHRRTPRRKARPRRGCLAAWPEPVRCWRAA